MSTLDDPEDRAAGLLALRTVAEAYGGLGLVAAEAGLSRDGTRFGTNQRVRAFS